MEKYIRSPWSLLVLGVLVLGFQAILSQLFYLERMATYDPAFFSFLMLDSGKPEAVLGRYGTWVSQILPWIVLVFEGSLQTFLKSYSLSFILLYFIFFLITLYAVKSKKAALALLVCCTVGYHYSFYYSTAELYQGLALSCMLWGILSRFFEVRGKQKLLFGLSAVLLTIWISFYHQILIIPLAFLLGFMVLGKQKDARSRNAILLYALMLGWFLFRVMYFEKTTYEARRMVKLEDFIEHTPNFFTLPGWGYFRWEINEMPALLLAILSAGFMLLLSKAWLRVAWLIAFCLGFLYLTIITDHGGQSPVMYENYYTIFGFFAAIVIAHSLSALTNPRVQTLSSAGLLFLLLLGAHQIHKGHTPFTRVVDYYSTTTEKMLANNTQKGLVSIHNHPWNFSWMSWPTPFTSALISTCEHEGRTATIYPVKEPWDIVEEHSGELVFLGPNWDPIWFTTDNLNKRFNLPPSSYVNLTTNGDGTHLSDHVNLEVLQDQVSQGQGSNTFVAVQIDNNSLDTLHSVLPSLEGLKIRYQISAEDGSEAGTDGYEEYSHFTGVDMDILPGQSAIIDVAIRKPPSSGVYRVEVDLYSTDTKHWWGVGDSFKFLN